MQIKILFFASLRDLAGSSEQKIEVDPGTTVANLWSQIAQDFDQLPEKVLCAVDQEYVDTAYTISESDHEVAFFPPVTGG